MGLFRISLKSELDFFNIGTRILSGIRNMSNTIKEVNRKIKLTRRRRRWEWSRAAREKGKK